MSFNQNSPGLVGLEWPAIREGVQKVDSSYNVVSAVFTSTVTETVRYLYFTFTSVVGANTSAWEAEVYNTAATDPGNAGFTQYNPNADYLASPSISSDTGGGPFWSHINGGAFGSGADWIQGGLGAPFPTVYSARFGGITGSLTGKHITNVRIESGLYLATGAVGDPSPMTLVPMLTLDGQGYNGQPVAIDQNFTYIRQDYRVNPATKVSWKIAEVEKLQSDADSGAGYYFAPTGSVNWAIRILNMWITVEWATTERRLAVGKVTAPTTGTRSSAALTSPTGTADWAKTTGLTYLVLLRRTYGGGSVSARWLDSGTACPHATHRTATVSFRSDGVIDIWGTTINAQTRAYALGIVKSDLNGSQDSQPYSSVNGDGGQGETWFGPPLTQIYGLVHQMQYFTSPATASYKSVQIFVRSGQPQRPTYPLSIIIKRVSDNVQFGNQILIQPEDLDPPYQSWRMIRVNLTTAAAFTSTHSYYADIGASDGLGDPNNRWEVQALSGMEAVGAFDTFNYGGTVNRLKWGGLFNEGDYVYADAVISIAQAPANVTSFAGVVQPHPLVTTSGSFTSFSTMYKAHLTWVKTSLATSFMQYEIQRSVDLSTTWQVIARIPTEAVQAFDDFEAPVGKLVSYRIRAIHTNGAAADWSSLVNLTMLWDTSYPGLVFASNEDPSLACGYLTEGPGREYTFLNADTIESRQFQGRDYQVAFRDLENRGLSFDVTLFIGYEAEPISRGEPMFQPLRDIATAPLSYVAVKNKDGEVWYSSVAVVSGVREDPDNYYRADVTVTQTSSLPSVVSP